jgi:hypothetical protein
MSSFLDLFPNEVRNLIYEMNPEHREMFNSFKYELELRGVNERLEYICNNFVEDSPSSSHMFRKFLDDPDYIIQKLNTCNCCSIHTMNKPISLTKQEIYYPFSYPPDDPEIPGNFVKTSQNTCKCRCQSYARMVFRSFDEHSIELDNLIAVYLGEE